MKKLNNHFSQFVILGVVAGAGLSVAPAQAQITVPPYDPGNVVDKIVDDCNDSGGVFLQPCDPNADVAIPAGPNPGLQGRVNFSPLGSPGGVILQGTGFQSPAGDPLTNVDFIPPEEGNIGRMFVVNASEGSDYQAYQGWTGTITDLRLTGTNGEPFPGVNSPVRVRDFLRVTNSVPGGGNGIVDGELTGGFALDLIVAEFPEYTSDGPFTTRVTIATQLQAYKLDTNGNRIEEQLAVTGGFRVFLDNSLGTFSSTFPNLVDGVPLRDRFDEASDAPVSAAYSSNINSSTVPGLIITGEIPEPTTILSSLLLFGGGAFKLNRRKRA